MDSLVGSRARRLLVALLVTTCSLTSMWGVGSLGAAEGPRQGGTLTYLPYGEVVSLDPMTFSVQVAPALAAPRGWAIFDALVAEDAASGTAVMRIAESLKSTDALVWTMKLRPDVKFSDGTTLDATAVKFNWDRVANPANRSPCTVVAQSLRTEVVDPLTLRITLQSANAGFALTLANVSCLTFVGSPTAIGARGADFATSPVGAGAFMVKEWVRDSHLTLVRNPNYYGKRPYVEQLVMRTIVDDAQRLSTVRIGDGDLGFSTTASQVAEAEKAGLKVVNVGAQGGTDIVFNMQRAPFDDLRARQAIAYAFDTKALGRTFYGDTSQVVSTIFREGSPYYAPSIAQPVPNQRKAQKLFDELAAEGKPLEVTFITLESLRLHTEWLQTRLASFKNVKANVEVVPAAAISPRLATGNFQASFFAHNFTDPSSAVFYDALITGGARNFSKYANPKVDAALKTAVGSLEAPERVEAWKTVQANIVKDLPLLFYSRQPSLLIYDPKVMHGIKNFWVGVPRFETAWKS